MTINVEAIVGLIIAALLAGNGYFIKRLIDKVDASAVAAGDAKTAVTSVANQLREIKSKIEDLRRIEIDVAVLKAMLGRHPRKDADSGGNEDDDKEQDV